MRVIKKRIDKWLEFENITRELVADFVDYIEVGQKNKATNEQLVQIHWLI